MGEDSNKIFKALSTFPSNFEELYDMTQKKIQSWLGYSEETIFIYYHDSLYGKIQIENNDELRAAIDQCYMYDYKSLKLYIYTYLLSTQMARSRQDFDDYNYASEESEESGNESDQLSDNPPTNYNENKINTHNDIDDKANLNRKFDEVCKITQSTYCDDKAEDHQKKLCQYDEESDSDDNDGSPQFLKFSAASDEKSQTKQPNSFEDSIPTKDVPKPIQPPMKKKEKVKEEISTINCKQPEKEVKRPQVPTEIKTQTEKDPVKKEKKPKRREDNEEEKKVEVKGDQKKLNKRKHKRMKYQCVYHPPFLTKMPINVDKEVQKHSTFSIFSSKIKNSIFGMNGEDADRLMRVDETELDLSNQDVILAKPGCLVKKSWRIKNIGIKEWPKGTKIVSVTDGLFYHPPKITNLLRPGEVMDIGIRIYIPKEEKDEGNLKEYIMRLYCEQLKCFGEPLIATIQVDSQLYDQISKTLPKNSDEYEYPRVTEDLKYVENYQSAKEMSEQKQIPFRKCLKQILQGNTI